MIIKNVKKIVKNILPWMEIDKKIFKIYKKSNKYILKNNKYLAYYYANKIYKKYGCIISPKADIGENLKLPHPIGVVIGSGAKIGNNVTIYQNVTIGWKYGDIEQCPEIGDNVIIYCNSTLVGDIKIGENTTVGCNSVVLKSVENNSRCVGVVK